MSHYFTMKKYGMKSDNPRREKGIIFFQWRFDFSKKYEKR